MICALIFDCFGVLYRDNLSMLYDAVPLEKQQDLRDIIHATDYGFLSREEYYAKVGELGGKTPEDIRAIEQRQHVRDEEMIAFSQTFKDRYKVGLLSNVDGDTMNRLFPEPGRSELFDVFVVSGEVGFTKPSPEIFELAADRLGLRPEECVMIDDMPANVDGARLAGMTGVLFTSRQQLQRDLERILHA